MPKIVDKGTPPEEQVVGKWMRCDSCQAGWVIERDDRKNVFTVMAGFALIEMKCPVCGTLNERRVSHLGRRPFWLLRLLRWPH